MHVCLNAGEGGEVDEAGDDRQLIDEHRVDDTDYSAHGEATVLDFLQLGFFGDRHLQGVEAQMPGFRGGIRMHVGIGHLALVQNILGHAAEQEDLRQAALRNREKRRGGERIRERGRR